MNQKKYIIANWKLYLGLDEVKAVAQGIKSAGLTSSDTLEVVVCPPDLSLADVKALDLSVSLGAQDCSIAPEGAHTGQTSSRALYTLGCRYVIIGHSERRGQLGEADGVVVQKFHAALESGLTPIVCVGETLAENEAGTGMDRVKEQLATLLSENTLHSDQHFIIAYEPIWAIYPSKKEVTTPYIHDMVEMIHEAVGSYVESANSYDVIYGGSVNSKNVSDYITLQGVSGVLPGHASTNADEFASIIAAVNEAA